jgi:hypothetical protein
MATTPTTYPSQVKATRAFASRRVRLATVVLAVVAPLALWALVEFGFDLDLRSPAFGDGDTADVGAGNVAIAAGIGSLLAWASLALLERVTWRAPKVWLACAIVALLVSFGGPLGGSGISWGNRVVLTSMHVLVAAVLIVGFYRSSPRRGATPQ